MFNFGLKNTDPEDIDDLLVKVEQSFKIDLVSEEMQGITTFGELCDYISSKIQLSHADTCTTQQAFYKLRSAVRTVLHVDNLKPDTLLTEIFPRERRTRALAIKQLEAELDVKLDILRPPHFITTVLLIGLLASMVALFTNPLLGIPGLLLSFLGINRAAKFGNKLNLKTVGELTQKIARENYLQSRRNATTVNRNEIEMLLIDWFSKDLSVKKSKLTRNATFE